MAPKQEHTGAELSSPHPQASTKRLKLKSEDVLTPRPEKRARRLHAQSDLAQNIQKLPQELQDDILDLVLAASLPSKPAQITIGREHNTFNTPLALRINRKTRAKFAELFYRQGQLLLVDTRGLPTEVLAKAIDDWFEIVDPRHHEYIVSVDFQCQDRSIRQYDSDDSDDSGGGYDDRYEMQGYNMDGVSMSMGEEYRGSSRVVGDGRIWSELSPHERRQWICGQGLKACLFGLAMYSVVGSFA